MTQVNCNNYDADLRLDIKIKKDTEWFPTVKGIQLFYQAPVSVMCSLQRNLNVINYIEVKLFDLVDSVILGNSLKNKMPTSFGSKFQDVYKKNRCVTIFNIQTESKNYHGVPNAPRPLVHRTSHGPLLRLTSLYLYKNIFLP